MVNTVDDFFVKADNVCDYIPTISTLSNLTDLFQKCVILPFKSNQTIDNNHYYTHLKNKSILRSIVLLIPVIGNIIVGIYDFALNNREKVLALLKKNGLALKYACERIKSDKGIMNPVQGTNSSQLEATQQNQNPSLGITVLPQELLEKIFTGLSRKNLSLMALTCKTFHIISKTAFLEKKQQVQSFLKRSWGTEFTQDIEERSVNSKDFEEFKKVINRFYSSIYFKYFLATDFFWQKKYAHTQLEDLSTIELLHEILDPSPVTPIMLLPGDFCSKLPLETVDTLVDMLIEKRTLDGISQRFDLLTDFNGIFPHSRKLLQHACRSNHYLPSCHRYMERASDRLKNDKEFVLKLIEEWKADIQIQAQFCLRYASDRLKNDKDVVLAAVKKDGFFLEFASDRLKGDKEVVLAALQTNLHYLTRDPKPLFFMGESQSKAHVDLHRAFIAMKRDYMRSLVPQALQDDPDISKLLNIMYR
jgi:hypothetical protein